MKRLFCVMLALPVLLCGGAKTVCAAPKPGEGATLAIGGQGDGKGKFYELRDMVFDRTGNLYVLDGLAFDKKTKTLVGNALVQKFDGKGKFQSQFSIRNDKLGIGDEPGRIAVDGAGRVYVSKPAADRVEQYSPNGALLQTIEIVGAHGLAVLRQEGTEKIAVIGSRTVPPARGKKEATILGGDAIQLLDPETAKIESTIALDRKLESATQLRIGPQNRFYILAAPRTLYVFGGDGKWIQSLGSGNLGKERNKDGSELYGALDVNEKGDVLTAGWGMVNLFDAKLETITQREGRFSWANTWGDYTRLAFAPDGGVWASVGKRNEEKDDPKGRYYVERPAILKLAANFFDPISLGVSQRSALLLGFRPSLVSPQPYQVAHDLKPFPIELSVAPFNRRLKEVEVSWRALDVFGRAVDKNKFTLPLQDGQAARHDFTVKPPKMGWYAVVCDFNAQGQRLQSIAHFFGITPRYAGLDAPADAPLKGGWEDAPRQMFSGLPLMRLHPAKGLDRLDKDIADAQKAGATFIVQLTDEADVQPDKVRALVTRFKGRIPIYEIINEPNISLKGGLARYVEIWKEIAPIIKGIDPQAKLMGPATVNMDLPWIDKFLAACAPQLDILSIHDYEGHGTIDPVHWKWKFGQLRAMLTKHGIGDREIWQTERAQGAVGRTLFSGPQQALQMIEHQDLLQTLGVPPEHNSHYYLNEGGYKSVPTWVWGSSGPHPAVLALRTRYAHTRGRAYLGTVDFGPGGNKIFRGMRFGPKDGDGGIVSVRNLGTLDVPLAIETAAPLDVRDAFDNAVAAPVTAGRATLQVGQFPLYLRLAANDKLKLPSWDFGKNIAAQAQFSYSESAYNPANPPQEIKPGAPAEEAAAAPEDAVKNPNNLLPELLTRDPFKLLVNGIWETHHAGGIYGGTRNAPVFNGALPSFPQTLEMSFAAPRSISKMLIVSEHADNAFCALLDYDLQAMQNGDWKTLAEVRTPLTPSTPAETPQATTLTWLQDPSFFVHQFAAPVTTQKLRLVVRRTSFGLAPDEGLRGWSKIIPPKLMLKEIEIY